MGEAMKGIVHIDEVQWLYTVEQILQEQTGREPTKQWIKGH